MAIQRKLTPEELEKKSKEVQALKKANAEREAQQLLEKSAIFKRLPGKVLMVVCILSVLVAGSFLVDGFFTPNYTKHKIYGSEKVSYSVATQDAYAITLTYHKAFLNESKSFSILMYKKQFEEAEKIGYVEVANTPITKMVVGFRVGEGETLVTKEVDNNIVKYILLPIALLFISLFWLFIDAGASEQTIFFGYLCMIIVPLLLIVHLIFIMNQYTNVGEYEMSVKSLIL
jgi:hypothetical protein